MNWKFQISLPQKNRSGIKIFYKKYSLALTEDELLNPFKFLKKVSKAVIMTEWFEFFEQCEQNSLAFDYEAYWDGIAKQKACTYYLPKLHDLGYLIVASEKPAK